MNRPRFASILATRPALTPLVVRVAAGLVFVAFSTGKYRRHDAEVAAFERYGIPVPDVTTYLVGTLEFACGALLVAGLLTRPAALALAANMVGAIATAGRLDPSAVHTVLAPALLIAMLYLVWAGGGRGSLDSRIARRLAAGSVPAIA